MFVYVYLYQMLAELVSLYQLVLSVFVLSLFKELLNSLSTTVSKVLLSLCLILSLIIFSKLLFERTIVKFTVNASFYYVTSTRARQRLIFWVFVAGEFYRQQYYYIDNSITVLIIHVNSSYSHNT